MLNYIWLGLILAAVVIGGATGRMEEVTGGALDSARMAVMNIALPLAGVMALWLGIMKLAEKSGIIYLIAAAIRPALGKLFPDIPREHPALGAIVMNIAANMLGLGNAATPFGIKAMRYLDQLSPTPGVATNAMCTLLAINTSSVQLVSLTTVGIFVAAGSAMPTAFIGTALVATICSTTVGIIAVKTLEKLPVFRMRAPTEAEMEKFRAEAGDPADDEAALTMARPGPMAWWKKGVLILFFAGFGFLFASELHFPLQFWSETVENIMPHENRDDDVDNTNEAAEAAHSEERRNPALQVFSTVMEAMALLAIPFLVGFFPLFASLQGVKVYEEFVEGAKEGFQVAVRIIPYLVAILIAIGMFREAGGIELLGVILGPFLLMVGFPVDLLPIAIMRPLSGSGTLGLLGDVVATHGPDSFTARAAGTMAGSTETTFYVLAVYFGAVGVHRTRHAVPAGLLADLAGVIAAVTVATIVFA